MEHLYAVGETACNGVHGRNRLASNSMLESLVFAKRAARHIVSGYEKIKEGCEPVIDTSCYRGYEEQFKELVLNAIEKEKKSHE